MARKTSRKKKEHKPKPLGPDIFQWGGTFPRDGVEAKKFGMSLETRQTKLLGGISRKVLPGYPGGAPEV